MSNKTKLDITKWLDDTLKAPRKKSMPILSFPSIQLLDITVEDLISSSDMQAKGMKAITEEVDVLASVSLMDLSVEAECFGSDIRFSKDEVPTVVGSVVSTMEDVEKLEVPEVGAARTGIYIEAIGKAAELITDRPVLAGVIGPFSLAGRLMDVTEAMIYCYEDPDMVHLLLEKVTDFLINYMKAYKEVGANGVVIAEPLAGMLSPDLSAEFSEKYVKKIIDSVKSDDFLVVYHNCGDAVVQMIDSILRTGAHLYHFGNSIDMMDMIPHIPEDILVMGNIDPTTQFMNGTPESMREAVFDLMERTKGHENFVISSGCDIPPLSSWDNIHAYFDAIEEFYDQQ